MLAAAEAASIRTRLAMLHPDWEETDVNAEVARIRAEQSADTADPEALHATSRPLADPTATASPTSRPTSRRSEARWR